MSFRLAAWLLAVVLGPLALASCGEPAREWPPARPAIWEVTGPGGAQGWLFGTIHALPADIRWRTPALEKAYEQADTLVVEIADIANGDSATEAFEQVASTPGLPPLSQRVAPADRGDLAAFLDRAGVSDDAFPHTETWAAALMLASAARPEGRTQSVDRQIVGGSKPVVGLETFAQQYALFDTLAPREQADLLMSLAREKQDDSRIEAWLTGDLDALEKQGGEGLLADPELREALQLARNRRWAVQVAALLHAGKKPLVAVGAAHMFGEEGLPALLQRAGFSVERVD